MSKFLKKTLLVIGEIISTIIALILYFYISNKLQLTTTSQLIIAGTGILLFYLFFKYTKRNQKILYVKIHKNNIILRDLLNKVENQIHFNNKFSTAKELVSNEYAYLEKILIQAHNEYIKSNWLLPRPVIFIHAMDTDIQELTETESDEFKKLAFCMNARLVFVITGKEELSDQELLDEYEHSDKK